MITDPMTMEEWDALEWLAQQTGKSAVELYTEQGASSFADLAAEYLPEGTNVLYDVAGDPFMVINNATGEIIYKTAADAVDSTAGVYASQYAVGANAVTSVETVTGETGALTSTLTSGANTAATTAAGKAGATIAGVTMQDAIFAGLAALGGVAMGVKWYSDNPEFWTHLSKALLPFAYGDSYKNSGDELADAMDALIPTTVDGNGKTYLPENFLNTLAQEVVKNRVLNGSGDIVSDKTEFQNVFPPIPINTRSTYWFVQNSGNNNGYRFWVQGSSVIYWVVIENTSISQSHSGDMYLFSRKPFKMTKAWGDVNKLTPNWSIYESSEEFATVDINIYYYIRTGVSTEIYNTNSTKILDTDITINNEKTFTNELGTIVLEGTARHHYPVPGIFPANGATLPKNDESSQDTYEPLQDTYPDWFNNALQTVDPKSTPQNVTYNNWLPVTIPTTDPTQKEGETTAPQTQAQTGNNPKDNPNVINKLVTAIQKLTETMTKPDGDTPVLPSTNTPTPTPTDTGDTPPSVPPVTSGSANGLWKVYNPSEGQLQAFGAWLWSSDIIEQIVKMISNPMNAIIGLHALYATPATGGAQSIKAGYLDSGVSAPVVTNQYTSIDCGSVIVPEAYKNALDYDYTNVSVYLPFIGIVPLNTREVMGSKISISYRVDVLTGTCLATISVSRQSSNAVLYTFSGNCAVQIPLTSGNYGTLLTGLLSAVGGVAASVVTGGAALPAVAGVGSAIVNARTNVSRTGNLGSNAGALGIRVPYLIITRPIAYDATNYSNYYGYPANKTVTLSSVSGFTRCKSVHVEGLPATEEEKTMIETALKNGVIF